jgi:hypothetical protein
MLRSVVLLASILVACTAAVPAPTSVPSTTTSPVPSLALRSLPPTPSLVAPTVTAAPSIAPTPEPPPWTGCRSTPDPVVPPSAFCVASVTGDLDGDRLADRLVVWGEGDNRVDHGWRWQVAAVLASGRVLRTTYDTPWYAAEPRGVIDVNGDGRGLVLVTWDRGASTATWLAFTVDGGQLLQVTDGDRGPLRIRMFGSGGRGNTFGCVTDAHGIPLLSLMGYGSRLPVPSDNTSTVFDWGVDNYRIRGSSALLVGTASGTVTSAVVSDPASDFNRTWQQCGLDTRGF